MESFSAVIFLLVHNLIGKPEIIFPDHARESARLARRSDKPSRF